MKIYIVSSEKHKGKIEEDLFTRDAFVRMGYASEISTLKDIVYLSQTSDVVILKSIWGYHSNYEDFLEHIKALRRKKVTLINDYDFIFWNIDKHAYLNEVRNMSIIPTKLLKLGKVETASEIDSLILGAGKEFNSNVLVIKPCISESGYLTFKYEVGADTSSVTSMLLKHRHREFIIQPFRSSVSEGEVSVIMINGTVLYGITRFPGIFHQKQNPIFMEAVSIPDTLFRTVTALDRFFSGKFGKLPVICRVDFLSTDSKYEILEIELIDPDLFFRNIPESLKQKTIMMIHNAFHL